MVQSESAMHNFRVFGTVKDTCPAMINYCFIAVLQKSIVPSVKCDWVLPCGSSNWKPNDHTVISVIQPVNG